MFKPIPGNNEYLISLSSEVRKLDGSIVSENIVDDKIDILLYGERKKIDLKWLALLAHFEIYLPEASLKSLLNVTFVNTNITILKPVSGKIPVFSRPVTVKNYDKIYRVISSHSRYAVSQEGEVIEISSGNVLKIMRERKRDNVVVDEYPTVYIYNPERMSYRYVLVHRLVALAWVNNHQNDHFLRPIVNHKDGNKKNFHYKNLEWCTFSENSIHAVNTGLRADNIACKVRDFYTGEVREFGSFSQAEAFMGLRVTAIRTDNFYVRKSKLLNGRYEIKLQTDSTPWFYENRTEKAKLGRYLISVTFQDGNVQYFHDLRDFKDKFKLWNCPRVSDLVAKASAENPGVKIELTDFYHSESIQSYHPETKEMIETKTIAEMSKRTNTAEHSIRKCLIGKETWLKNGRAFRYKNDNPWPTEFIDKDQKSNILFKAINLITKEEIEFNGIRPSARFFKVDRGWIKNCLINGHSLNGWKLIQNQE